MTDVFDLAAPVTALDRVLPCWDMKAYAVIPHAHEPHAWAFLEGRTLHPRQCPGLYFKPQDIVWQWPIMSEQELFQAWRVSLDSYQMVLPPMNPASWLIPNG